MNKKELRKILRKHDLWLRNKKGGEKADFSYANLSGADLRCVNLRRADLCYANLSGADLSNADLSRADLRGANLRGADLYGAGLCGANLRGADLCDADLSRADLRRADLYGAGLHRANVDFSCWPLHCGSFYPKVDDRLVSQLIHHVAKLDVSDCSETVRCAHQFIFKSWAGKLLVNMFCKYRDDVDPIA